MRIQMAVVLFLSIICAGCETLGSRKAAASATLEPRSGSSVSGLATLYQTRDGAVMHVELTGLSPGSEHGFHVHEKGDCSAADASSAGGHFNPLNATHGRAGFGPHHLGDLSAVVADAQGRVTVDIALTELTIAPGPNSVIGHSLVVHRDRDDYVTPPAGNAGPRIACGVVTAL